MTDHQAPDRQRQAVWALRFLAAATIGTTAAYLIRENADGDSWWHVAIGREIITSGAIPRVDTFSTLGLGRAYHDSHWLFQVLLAAADRLAGITGAGLVAILLWTLTLLLCYRTLRRWVSLPAACLLLLAVVLGVNDRFIPRPDTVTCLMIAAFYLLLESERWRKWPGITLLVLLQIGWSNSHGLFVIGPFMVFCYWIDAILRRRVARDPAPATLSVLLALVTGASFVTPFGPSGWRYAFLLFTEVTSSGPAFFTDIGELAPTFGASSVVLPDFWFFAGFLAAWGLAAASGLYRRSMSIPRLLITASLLAAACSGRRNMALFLLTAAPFIAEQSRGLVRPFKTDIRIGWAAGAFAILLAWFPLSGTYYELMRLPVRFGLGPSRTLFSPGLPAFLGRSGYTGQIFNSADLGGFCLYHGYRPLLDTRWEVYGPRLLGDFYAAASDPSRWRSLVVRYDIRGILLAHSSAEARSFLRRLPGDPKWRLVWYDTSSSFWALAGTLPSVAGVDPDRMDDRVLLPARTEELYLLAYFYQSVGAFRNAIGCYERALAREGMRESTLEEMGSLQVMVGLVREGEATFRRLLSVSPQNRRALRALATTALMRGDTASARMYARRVLQVDPQDGEARAFLEKLDGSTVRQ